MRQPKTFMKLVAWMWVVQRWQRSDIPSRRAPAPLTRTRSGSDFKAVNSRELIHTNNEIGVPALHILIESKYVQEVINILNEVDRGNKTTVGEMDKGKKSVYEEGGR